jgi:hypothetical protein
MLRRSNILRLMNEEYTERYSLIERHLDAPTSDLYRGTTKQERRLAISQRKKRERERSTTLVYLFTPSSFK